MKAQDADRYTSYEWGVLWMLLSAIALSASILFLRLNLSHIDYFFLLFLRFFIPFLYVLFLVMLRWEWKALISSHISLHILRCLCVLVGQYGIAYYLTKNTLLNATVLLNASPLFIPLIEWIFFSQRPGKSTIISALLAFFGVLLVLRPDRSLFSLLSAVGLLAALGQAGSQVLYGLKSKTENLISSLFYLFFFTSSFSLIIFLLSAKKEAWESLQKENLTLLISILLMGVFTLLNQYFRGLAYRCSRPSTLATFLYFSVFVSALFDWVIFRHIPSFIVAIGSILIILAGILKIFLRAHILRKKKK